MKFSRKTPRSDAHAMTTILCRGLSIKSPTPGEEIYGVPNLWGTQCAYCLTQCPGRMMPAVAPSRCSGCSTAHYCNAQCQRNHWEQHRRFCKWVRLHKERYIELEPSVEQLVPFSARDCEMIRRGALKAGLSTTANKLVCLQWHKDSPYSRSIMASMSRGMPTQVVLAEFYATEVWGRPNALADGDQHFQVFSLEQFADPDTNTHGPSLVALVRRVLELPGEANCVIVRLDDKAFESVVVGKLV